MTPARRGGIETLMETPELDSLDRSGNGRLTSVPSFVGWVSEAQPTGRKTVPFGGSRFAYPPYKKTGDCTELYPNRGLTISSKPEEGLAAQNHFPLLIWS